MRHYHGIVGRVHGVHPSYRFVKRAGKNQIGGQAQGSRAARPTKTPALDLVPRRTLTRSLEQIHNGLATSQNAPRFRRTLLAHVETDASVTFLGKQGHEPRVVVEPPYNGVRGGIPTLICATAWNRLGADVADPLVLAHHRNHDCTNLLLRLRQ